MEEGDALDEVERIVKKPKILPPLTISVLKKWEEQAEKVLYLFYLKNSI